jgi:membrane associated rhomboid family serine protease
VYRLNTFPLIHQNFFHMIFNILALTPLMERFEAEFGTLTSLSLFFGRESCPVVQKFRMV